MVTLADGRTLYATRDDPTADWVVRVDDDLATERRGRWLLPLVYQALGLGVDNRPQAMRVVDRLTGFDTPVGRRFPCPCCDLLTLEEPPTGTHQLCPVCYWEDDAQQYEHLDQLSGANGVTLRQARDNFVASGVSDQAHRGSVRPLESYEVPPG